MAEITGNLTANAILSKELFRDDFNRTVGPTVPFAAGDLGPDYVLSYVQSGGQAWVDGSAIRLTANKGLGAYLADQSLRIDEGYVQYDFWVPADIYDENSYFWVNQGGAYPFAVEIWTSTGGWRAQTYYYYQSVDAQVDFSPEPSTWYRVKGFFNGTPGGDIGIKVWKASDPEPDAFAATGYVSELAVPLNPVDWFDTQLSLYAPDVETMGFDNLVIASYGTPYLPTKFGRLTAGAVKRKTMPTRTAALDSYIVPLYFTAGAWIVGGRSGHSRMWDHYGTEPDTVVVLDGSIGKYPSGTTVHAVLADLIDRVTALESGNHVVLTFGAGAFIQPCIRAAAVIFRPDVVYDPYWGDLDLKVDAVLVRGKTNQLITADAVIIRAPEASFGADAYLIDLVC